MEELRLELAELYIAYFDRAPDTDGLAYWTQEMQSGHMDYDAIAANWSNEQQEFTDTYGKMFLMMILLLKFMKMF